MHEFYKSKLINKLTINSEKIYFDTNMSDHHHFYNKEDDELAPIVAVAGEDEIRLLEDEEL